MQAWENYSRKSTAVSVVMFVQFSVHVQVVTVSNYHLSYSDMILIMC